jgi:hypothetical protein
MKIFRFIKKVFNDFLCELKRNQFVAALSLSVVLILIIFAGMCVIGAIASLFNIFPPHLSIPERGALFKNSID